MRFKGSSLDLEQYVYCSWGSGFVGASERLRIRICCLKGLHSAYNVGLNNSIVNTGRRYIVKHWRAWTQLPSDGHLGDVASCADDNKEETGRNSYL